jgi:hypothetical protein
MLRKDDDHLMTCDRCALVLPCWQGQIERRACAFCKRVELFLWTPIPGRTQQSWDGTIQHVVVPRVIIQSCPPEIGMPTAYYNATRDTYEPAYRESRIVCPHCRKRLGWEPDNRLQILHLDDPTIRAATVHYADEGDGPP